MTEQPFQCEDCEFVTSIEVVSDNHAEDRGHTMIVKWTQPDFGGYLEEQDE